MIPHEDDHPRSRNLDRDQTIPVHRPELPPVRAGRSPGRGQESSAKPSATRPITAGPTGSAGTGEQARYSDDGEPRGTAGPPILEVLKKNDATNVLVVVTRYYGGIKLGAGGLARAYGDAAKRVLEESRLKDLRLMADIEAPVPYPLLGASRKLPGRGGRRNHRKNVRRIRPRPASPSGRPGSRLSRRSTPA